MFRKALLFTVAALLSGCGTGPNRTGEEQSALSRSKITADAYLFDATLYREGKPTSVRLECYVTDSVVGLSGRGYLGKGALKGRLTRDSINVYFPSTNEYLSEKSGDLLISAAGCAQVKAEADLLSLFSSVPESRNWGETFAITRSGDDDQPQYQISLGDCGWEFTLEYRESDASLFLNKFEFNDGHGSRLKAKRRTLKREASVPSNRFQVDLPIGAVRIIP
ncbi:MAG: hypothetical protein P1R58_05950 [bacterium]|nr:hypothetical protein [bacterium]